MDTQNIAIFCMCDDMLKALHHRDDPQSQIMAAEVMNTAILAALPSMPIIVSQLPPI